MGSALVCPYSVTVMVAWLPFCTKSSITWLFVTTSPSDVMIMPVPSSSAPFDLTSIDTTAGITFCTSCGMVTLPLNTAAPGVALLSWMVTAEPPLPLLFPASAVTPAPTPPPMTAATTATGSQVRTRPGVRLESPLSELWAAMVGGYANGAVVGGTGVGAPVS